jgi:serine/threonine protein kinase
MKIMKKRKYSGLLNFVLTEKEVSRKVRHPSIVRLFYAFQTFDKLYLLTEFCPGGDLRALLSSKGAPKNGLSESEAKLYLAEVLVAIDELHKNGILHRDIKPENIMLDA